MKCVFKNSDYVELLSLIKTVKKSKTEDLSWPQLPLRATRFEEVQHQSIPLSFPRGTEYASYFHECPISRLHSRYKNLWLRAARCSVEAWTAGLLEQMWIQCVVEEQLTKGDEGKELFNHHITFTGNIIILLFSLKSGLLPACSWYKVKKKKLYAWKNKQPLINFPKTLACSCWQQHANVSSMGCCTVSMSLFQHIQYISHCYLPPVAENVTAKD